MTGAGRFGLAVRLLLLAYLSLAVLDPIAARREEVSNYFAGLRPMQMGLAVLSLAVVGLRFAGWIWGGVLQLIERAPVDTSRASREACGTLNA